jgi:hypothetical protein
MDGIALAMKLPAKLTIGDAAIDRDGAMVAVD